MTSIAMPQRGGDPRPIGVFDSGVGGLTVARALIDLLPGEQLVYLGDTAHGPYGPRELAEVRGFARGLVDALEDAGAKLVVIACNTASAAAVEADPIPSRVGVHGVIAPAVREARAATRTGRVGVIGTAATISSGAYDRALFRLDPELKVFSEACPAFVSFVEAGRTTDPEVLDAVAASLAPLVAAEVDTVVLGCTHYPLLTGAIARVLGPEVVLVSSAEATARAVFADLVNRQLLSPASLDPGAPAADGEHRFLATGDPRAFARMAARFLGPRLVGVEVEAADVPR